MPEERSETREEEVARVRSYLASQSLRRLPAQLVETLQQAHQQFLQALAEVPDNLIRAIPCEGEWTVIDVLSHVRAIAEFDYTTIVAVIERGEQPPNVQDAIISAPEGATCEQLLADLKFLREQLFTSVLQADPEAHLEITWSHPEFGAMHWREWLLFARVHTLDHARQIQAIASALNQQKGASAHETGH